MSATIHHTPVAAYECPECGGRHLTVVRGDPHEQRIGCAYCPTVSTRHELVAFDVIDAPPFEVDPEDALADYERVDEARYDDYRAVVVEGERPHEWADERGVAASTVRANVTRARQAITM